MSKFAWGKVIECFEYDFDGDKLSVTKYNPFNYEKNGGNTGRFTEEICYHVEEMREAFNSMQALLIAWIAYKNLGHNNGSLVAGVCRALEVK
jgi:hypothetical protein